MDLCEFKANLVYRASSRTARATQGNPVLKSQKRKQQTNKTTKARHVVLEFFERNIKKLKVEIHFNTRFYFYQTLPKSGILA